MSDAELRVNWIRCEAFGLCHDLMPDFIDLDEWGYPIVLPGGVPGRRLGDARRAVDCCPVRALSISTQGARRGSRTSIRRARVRG